MNSKEMMSIYENVSLLTGQMVVAAQQGDWALLSKLEAKCTLHFNTVKKDPTPVQLDQKDRARKISVIQKILDDDRKIRDITEPHMARLSKLMQRTSTKRKLSNAYQLDHRTSRF